jgi:hypothetical protein
MARNARRLISRGSRIWLARISLGCESEVGTDLGEATHSFNCEAHRATIYTMQTEQIVAILIQERDKLNRAIDALQGPMKRRGRPPRNPTDAASVASPSPAKKKRRKFSAAQREAAAERMRQRWAVKKKSEGKSQPKSVPKPQRTAKAV